jgi:hypothetical protein
LAMPSVSPPADNRPHTYRPYCRWRITMCLHDSTIVKIDFEDAAAPLAKLIGHSIAAAAGFCALAVISLLPIEILRLLSLIGITELVQPLQVLEQMLLFADV